MKTMYSLTEMAQELRRQSEAKVDYLAPTNRIVWTTHPANGVPAGTSDVDLYTVDVPPLRVTEHGHHQVGTRLDIPRKFYERLRVEVPDLHAEMINRLLRHHPGGQPPRWMIRSLDQNARAFLSDRYRRLDNDEIAQAVFPLLGDIPDVKFPSLALTDSRLYIKAVSPRTTAEVKVGDEVCAGVVIKNSEVGVGSVSVEPLIYRLVCSNGMIVGQKGAGMMQRVHVGRRLEADSSGVVFRGETLAADDRAFMLALRDVVKAAVSDVRFRELVASMQQAASSEPVTDPVAAVEILAKRENLGEGESRDVLRHLASGGDLTRWGMINAVTLTAQAASDYDRATDLEGIGGNVLAYKPADWRQLVEA